MMINAINFLELAIWSGIAAVGFGVLFNIPKKAIITVFALGFGAGFVKFILLKNDFDIILSSLIAAILVGILSTPLSHKIHQPPVVFSIPAVIPMIPGFFAYKTILSVMKFTFMEYDNAKRLDLIEAIFSNGFTMIFILIALTVGVSFPLLLLRKSTFKKIESN
jgi:uncharacterized membrane protein YjjB (DUF3815 family)